MKITVNLDCTPEEARTFMGLPDVQPLQEALMRELENRMLSGMKAMSPESVLSNWMPNGAQGAEQLQKLFWAPFQSAVENMTKATSAAITYTTTPTGDKK